MTPGPGRRNGRTLLKLEHVEARHRAIAKLEPDTWPSLGDVGLVKCSDLRWRRAEVVEERGQLAWRFANGALRLLATSTARRLDATELPGHHLQRAAAENA